MTTETAQYHPRTHNGHYRSSGEIQSDIEQTRLEMDQTLDELGDRLHPKHLLDYVVEYFRSPSTPNRVASERVREVAGAAVDQVKRHPLPSVLVGAGIAWWLLEGKDGHGGPSDSRRDRGDLSLHDEDYADEWTQEVAAWHPAYEWTGAGQDEKSWTERARATFASMRATLSDTTKSAADKVKHAASSLIGLSGHQREAIHARWANLREHAGSFVDARTGEPYDDSYGREWRDLCAADFLAHTEASDSKGWSEKAGDLVKDLQSSLAHGGENIRETARTMAGKLGSFATATGGFSAEYARKLGRGAGSLKRRTSHGVSRLAGGARQMGGRVQEQVQHGYLASRRRAADALDEYPLAASVAALGLGLVAGFILPRSRMEDRWMGEASEDVKERAKEAAKEVVDRGKQVASATTSAAMDEARRQGLMPDQLGEKVSQTMGKAKEAAEEQLRPS